MDKQGGRLLEKRENFSRKRAAILRALQEARNHPSAEWIYRQLKPRYPDLSLGTVYRNLGRFCESGQVVSLGVVGGHERFDGDISPHAHLVCAGCGVVVDIPREMPGEEELAAVSNETGCRVSGASVTFTGLCPQCVEREKQDGTKEDHL